MLVAFGRQTSLHITGPMPQSYSQNLKFWWKVLPLDDEIIELATHGICCRPSHFGITLAYL